MTTKPNSRQLAKNWPPRHNVFIKKLRFAAVNWFKSKGYECNPKMKYILKQWTDWPKNIILKEVTKYIETEKEKAIGNKKDTFPLHKYLHHGLSSQAMVFNLIGPLIIREDYTPIINIFKSKKIPKTDRITKATFEYDDRDVFNEDTGQPTSIDLTLWANSDNPVFFIESKLAENEFGGCSVFEGGDCNGKNPIGNLSDCFLHHIGRKYWILMEKYGISEILKNERMCVFIAYYQFFRELLLALEKNGTFILLSDDRSPVFQNTVDGKKKGLINFLMDMLPQNIKDKISLISVQEVVSEIKKCPGHEDWIGEFERKYGLIN